jgi:hypothetical protein
MSEVYEVKETAKVPKYKAIDGVKFVQYDQFGIPMTDGTDY